MFSHLTFTSSDFDDEEKQKIKSMIESESGKYIGQMDSSINYLICNKSGSNKYMEAMSRQIHVVHYDWLEHSVTEKHILQPSLFQIPLFLNISFTTTGADIKQIGSVCRIVKDNGGNFDTGLQSGKTDILIVYNNNTKSEKYIWAKQHNLWIVDEYWIENCLHYKRFIHPKQYNEILELKNQTYANSMKTISTTNRNNEDVSTIPIVNSDIKKNEHIAIPDLESDSINTTKVLKPLNISSTLSTNMIPTSSVSQSSLSSSNLSSSFLPCSLPSTHSVLNLNTNIKDSLNLLATDNNNNNNNNNNTSNKLTIESKSEESTLSVSKINSKNSQITPNLSITNRVISSTYISNTLYNPQLYSYPAPSSLIFIGCMFYFVGNKTWTLQCIKKIIQLGGFWLDSLSMCTTHIVVETQEDYQTTEQLLLKTNFMPISTPILKASYIDLCIQNQSIEQPSLKYKWSNGLLGSLIFYIYPFEKDTDKVQQTITKFGGTLAGILNKNNLQSYITDTESIPTDTSVSYYDFIICPRTVQTDIYKNPKCRSISWLKDCITQNTILSCDLNILYVPMSPLLLDQHICFSGLGKEDKIQLEKVAIALKATIDYELTPSTQYLIVDNKYTSKVKTAVSLSIPVLNKQILYDIAKNHIFPSTDLYVVDIKSLITSNQSLHRSSSVSSSRISLTSMPSTPIHRTSIHSISTHESTVPATIPTTSSVLNAEISQTISNSIYSTITKNYSSSTSSLRRSSNNNQNTSMSLNMKRNSLKDKQAHDENEHYTSFSQIKDKTDSPTKSIGTLERRKSLLQSLHTSEVIDTYPQIPPEEAKQKNILKNRSFSLPSSTTNDTKFITNLMKNEDTNDSITTEKTQSTTIPVSTTTVTTENTNTDVTNHSLSSSNYSKDKSNTIINTVEIEKKQSPALVFSPSLLSAQHETTKENSEDMLVAAITSLRDTSINLKEKALQTVRTMKDINEMNIDSNSKSSDKTDKTKSKRNGTKTRGRGRGRTKK